MSDRPRSPRAEAPKARGITEKPRGKLSRLVKRPGAIVGNPSELAEAPAFDQAAWRKKWDKRLK